MLSHSVLTRTPKYPASTPVDSLPTFFKVTSPVMSSPGILNGKFTFEICAMATIYSLSYSYPKSTKGFLMLHFVTGAPMVKIINYIELYRFILYTTMF